MRNLAPQLVSYNETSFRATGTVTTGTLSWKAGDIIVVLHGNEGAATLGTPTTTGSGLSFIVLQSNTTISTCPTKLSYAVATADSSGTISATCSSGNSGIGVYVWRGSDGIGVSAESHIASRAVQMTPTDTHSAIAWGVFDFGAGTVGKLSPTPTTTRQAAFLATAYSYYLGEVQDQPTANALTWGITGSTSTDMFSVLAVEILGTTSPAPRGPVKIGASLGTLSSTQSSSQLLRTSTGNLYAVLISSGDVQVYKSTSQGVSWALQDYLNVPSTTDVHIAAAIDGNDNIHIAFERTATTTGYVLYTTSTDTFGRVEQVDVTAPNGGLAIATDSNNIPHIARCGTSSAARYTNRLSGAWKPVVLVFSGTGTIQNLDLQIDQNNLPQVTCLDATDGLRAVIGNKNNATSFTAQVLTTSLTMAGASSLTIDISGNTWVGYQSAQNGPVLLAKHNQKDPWSTWQSPITNGFSGKSISLAADLSNIYILYERNAGGIAYDRYDTVNGNWLGEQILQPQVISNNNKQPSFQPHNPFVKWSQYFNNGDTGANNTAQDTIEYLFDDGSTIYYDKLVTVQISTGYVNFTFTPQAGATTTSTSSTSSSTSISTSSTSSSTSISTSSTSSSISTSTSSTSSSTSRSTSTSSTSSSTSTSVSTSSTSSSISTSSTSSSISTSSTSQSTSTSSTSQSTSTSVSTSTSSTSSSTSRSTSTSSTSSSISTSSTSSSISTSSTSSSISTSSTSQSTSISTSTSTSSTSLSTSTSISTSSTSSSTSTSSTSSSISTSSTSSSTSTSQSTSTSSTSQSTSISTSTSSTSSSISTSSTSSSISTSSTSSSTSTSSTSSSTSKSTSTSSTSQSTSLSTSTSSTSSSISTSSTSSSISTSSTSSSVSTSTSISSTSSSISTTVSLTTSTSSTSASTSISTSSTSSSTSISTSSTSSSISTSSTSSSRSTSTTSTSQSTSQSTSTSSTSQSTSLSTSTSSTSQSTSQSTSTSSTSSSTSLSTTVTTTSTSSTSFSTSSTSLSTSTSTTALDVNMIPRAFIRVSPQWHRIIQPRGVVR